MKPCKVKAFFSHINWATSLSQSHEFLQNDYAPSNHLEYKVPLPLRRVKIVLKENRGILMNGVITY